MTLPPGRARLATKPSPTGSPTGRHHDGDGSSRFLRRQRRWSSCDHDQINLKTNQVRRKLRQALSLLLGKPVLDGDILSLNPSKLAQLLPERFQEDRATGSSAMDPGNLCGRFSLPAARDLAGRSREARSLLRRAIFDKDFLIASWFFLDTGPQQCVLSSYSDRRSPLHSTCPPSMVIQDTAERISHRTVRYRATNPVTVTNPVRTAPRNCPREFSSGSPSRRFSFRETLRQPSGKSESPWG